MWRDTYKIRGILIKDDKIQDTRYIYIWTQSVSIFSYLKNIRNKFKKNHIFIRHRY